jgi:L-ribulose-5-phosphate 3-epimerase
VADQTGVVLAASPFCFFGFDPFVAYRCLAQAGIGRVEVPAFPARQAIRWGLTTFAPELMDDADVAALKGHLAELGLEPVTVAALCDVLDAGDAAALRRRVDFAAGLGASTVIADAGERIAAVDGWSRAIANVRELGRYAAGAGVQIALETHEGATRTGRIARRLLEEIDHPAVGLNYDTANIVYYNADVDPALDIREVAEWVRHVHLKDTAGGQGEWQFCALGQGRVDFPAIVAALRSVGFRGTYSLEIEGREGEDLNRADHLARVRQSVEYLRQIGLLGSA